jgi:hypothetical protein
VGDQRAGDVGGLPKKPEIERADRARAVSPAGMKTSATKTWGWERARGSRRAAEVRTLRVLEAAVERVKAVRG